MADDDLFLDDLAGGEGGAADDGDDRDDGGGPWVRCALAQIMATDPPNPSFVVVLREAEGERAFPIYIGPFEWHAIHRPLHGYTPDRPETHDLLLACVEGLGARLRQIRVRDLVEDDDGDGTFYGSLLLERGGEFVEIDCRPSDALALSVRRDCPVWVSERILDRLSGE